MDLGMKGRVAVVTGGGTGIGKAVAAEFAAEGATTYILGRRQEMLDEAAAEAKDKGVTLIPYALDVLDNAAVEKCVNDIVAAHGRVDIWVNNAGFGYAKMIEDVEEEDWFKTIDTNLKSTFFVTKTVARQMKKQKYGVFINAASMAVYMPLAGNSVYAAAKSGIASFTRTFAAELAPYGIRVLSYSPGMVATAMSKRHIARDYDKLVNTMALHRLGTPEDLAKPIVFFASEAAGYMTGIDIPLAGGRYCSQNNEDMWVKAGADAIVPEKVI
ncbi:MAG: SDR family oxidoreductase [Clostridiales Family XIII bacterium]|jgi:3-oxoacyl-[acyl-carrier protein] reductase|nr:SDR family oxidoreductase [Clostridiales Family XIII bacterium]